MDYKVNKYYEEISEDYKTYSDYYYVKKIKRIDELVYKMAKNPKNNTFYTSEKIIELTYKKAKLIQGKKSLMKHLNF